MSFKIRSSVSVYEYPPPGSGAEGVHHVVLSREKPLHPGEKIAVSGSITYDEEAKGGWISAKGEIRIIDEGTLGIRWRPSIIDTLINTAIGPEISEVRPRISEVKEYARWGQERVVIAKSGEPPKWKDPYSSEPTLPEIFTPIDRLKIKTLTEKKLREIEGMKHVVRETKLVYEPDEK
jgi:hypothetical protein